MAGDWRRSSMVGACLLLVCSAALAADPDTPLRLPETVIDAGDGQWRATTPSVTHIDDVEADAAITLDDSLTIVPGVYAQNRDNLAQGLRISIRGFGSRASFGVRGIRVLVDDVPLTLPDGQTELDLLDLDLVDRISVSRGAAGALYGNAAGGVIAVQNRIAMPEPYLGGKFETGSHGLQQLRVEGGRNLFDVDTLGAFRQLRQDGYRDHAGFDSHLLNLRSSLATGFGTLGVDFSALEIEADDPGALTDLQRREDRRQAAPGNLAFDAGEEIEQQRVALRWEADSARFSRLYAVLFAGQREFDNRLPFTGGGQVSFERDAGGLSTGLRWNPAFMQHAHEIDIGLDVQLQRDDRSRYNNLNGVRGALTLRQDEDADNTGLFVQDSWTLNPNWVLTAAARYDDLRLEVNDRFLADGDDSGERDFGDWSYSGSLARRLGQSHQLQARVATSFESPTFTELANPAGGGFNPDLEAADTLSYEVGISGDFDNFGYEIVAYRIEIDDELIPFELAAQPGRSFYRNAGESRRDGLEAALSAPIGDRFTIGAVATLSDYRFRDYQRGGTDFSGKRIPGVPDRHGALTLDYAANGLTANATLDVTGKLFADDANTQRISGYGLLHLKAGYEWQLGRWRLMPYAGVRNLLDKEYNDNVRINAFGGRLFEPAAERTWIAGLHAAIF